MSSRRRLVERRPSAGREAPAPRHDPVRPSVAPGQLGCGVRKLGSSVESPGLQQDRACTATRPVERGSVILGVMVDGESTGADANNPAPAAPETEQKVRDLGHYVPRDLLDISFPVSVRGYERCDVSAYIRRVNRVIAE